MSRIKTPLIYTGGKTRGINQIRPHFPRSLKEMVSPFVGGGSLEVAMDRRGVRVIGSDIENCLVCFWRYAIADGEAVARLARTYLPITGKDIEKYKAIKHEVLTMEDSLERAAKYYAINRSSFAGGGIKTGVSPKKINFNRRNLHTLKNFRTRKFSVDCLDFRDALARHPDTFAYVDPPYMIPGGDYYGARGERMRGFPHQEMFELLKDRPRWIMSQTDNQAVRDLYKGFTILTPKWAYTLRKAGSQETLIFSRDLEPNYRFLADMERQKRQEAQALDRIESLRAEYLASRVHTTPRAGANSQYRSYRHHDLGNEISIEDEASATRSYPRS